MFVSSSSTQSGISIEALFAIKTVRQTRSIKGHICFSFYTTELFWSRITDAPSVQNPIKFFKGM